jgi:prepilin-type N-terminal cleavage/methylation domain-containing protein
MKMNKKSGFTLLEIIIVIIIVGVLASLALPRFFSTIEYSRSTEALSAISALRQSVERCYLSNGGTYAGCVIGAIDLDDPANSPGNHFTYTIIPNGTAGYTVRAERNATEGGTLSDHITLIQAPAGVTRTGTGSFAGIK